ncbi:uncharacterized protein LOC123690150 [Pieris rapae]|uniref:uncharacterized protein LOC123690150 n=1 Tax=Pieris rapae TaxID=64459 RepID=UPI001E27F5E3|nr:uncharacterized protein LOC123690150 [Pieris rapae]
MIARHDATLGPRGGGVSTFAHGTIAPARVTIGSGDKVSGSQTDAGDIARRTPRPQSSGGENAYQANTDYVTVAKRNGVKLTANQQTLQRIEKSIQWAKTQQSKSLQHNFVSENRFNALQIEEVKESTSQPVTQQSPSTNGSPDLQTRKQGRPNSPPTALPNKKAKQIINNAPAIIVRDANITASQAKITEIRNIVTKAKSKLSVFKSQIIIQPADVEARRGILEELRTSITPERVIAPKPKSERILTTKVVFKNDVYGESDTDIATEVRDALTSNQYQPRDWETTEPRYWSSARRSHRSAS